MEEVTVIRRKITLFALLALVIVAMSAMKVPADEQPATDDVAPRNLPSSLALASAATRALPSVSTALVFPVAREGLNSVISQFGDARDHGQRPHLGIDIAAPRGTPVLAVRAGKVERVEHTGAGGRVVWLSENGTNRHHYFAHLERIAVTPGQRVQAGQVIGTVGTSGNASATRPHLHYAVRVGNEMLDPTTLFRHRTAAVDPVDGVRAMRTRLGGGALKATPGGVTIAVIPANQPVIVQAESGRYYRVRYHGKEGYLARWLLKTP